MPKKISEQELAIADRFFYALDVLIERRVIRGIKTFCDRHGFNQGNMSSIRGNRTHYSLKTEHLACLAQDYGVSCEWLLLGNGDMFKPYSPALYFREREEISSRE